MRRQLVRTLWGAAVAIVLIAVVASARSCETGDGNSRGTQEREELRPRDPRGSDASGRVAVSHDIPLTIEVSGPTSLLARGWIVEVRQEAREPHELRGNGSATVSAEIDKRVAARCHLRPQGSTSVVATWEPTQPGPARVRLHVTGVGRIVGRLVSGGLPVASEHVGAGPTSWLAPKWFPRARTPFAEVLSGQDGTFEIVGLRAGTEYGVEAGGRTFVRSVHGPFVATHDEEGSVVEIELTRGASVQGRVLDEEHTPLTGVRVHVYRDQSAGPVLESVYVESAWTDQEGRFQFASSPSGESLLLKTFVRRDGSYLCVQRRLVPMAPGEERQVGDLVAGALRLTFRLVDEANPESYQVVFSALGAGSDTHPSMALGGLEFDASGECHVVGVPGGEISWHVASMAPATDASAGGEFHLSHDRVVDVAVVHREVADDSPTMTVRLQFDAGDEREMDVLLSRDGAIEQRFKRVGGQGQLPFETRAGRVRIMARTADGAVWDHELEGAESSVEEPRVRVEQAGVVARVTVVSGGARVADAEVAMIGFRRHARGHLSAATFDMRTDDEGRFEIHGLPDGIEGVRVLVQQGRTGVMRFVPREEFDAATIDVSPR